MVCARRVIVVATCGIGESVVGIVNDLEFASAICAFGGVGGDTVGVRFEGCSGRMLALDFEEEKEHTSCRHLEFAAGLPMKKYLGLHLVDVRNLLKNGL
jgi:hypothetical protein